jgi:hypothetical protein
VNPADEDLATHAWRCSERRAWSFRPGRWSGGPRLGVIDGRPPAGIEGEADVADRKALLRAIGYKL